MLKMNRGAAGRNARVIDMEELKQARERRAASARRPDDGGGEYGGAFREQYEEWREERDDAPFWERDDPFGADGFVPRRRAARERRARQSEPEEQYEAYEPEPEERAIPRRGRARLEYEDRRPRRSEPKAQYEAYGPEPEERAAPRRGRARPEYEERRQPQGRQGRHEEEPRQSRKQEREAQAPRSRTGLYMLLLLLGLLALAVVIGLKVFEITTIEVKGNDTMTAESVVALSGIARGENIFKVNLGQARKNLESDPLVEVLGISRIFPDKIRIMIRQRKPHGAIAYMGAYVVIDERGFVLDERADLPAGQYPLITGVDIQPSRKGKPLVGVNAEKLNAMNQLLAALYDNQAIGFVSEANLSEADNIRLLTGEGLEIDLGKPTDLPKKAQWIACTVPELRKNGYTSGILYVTGTGSPVYASSPVSGDGAKEGDSAGTAQQSNDDGADEGGDGGGEAQAGAGGQANASGSAA